MAWTVTAVPVDDDDAEEDEEDEDDDGSECGGREGASVVVVSPAAGAWYQCDGPINRRNNIQSLSQHRMRRLALCDVCLCVG